jgi:hypothetical protein
MKRTLILFCLGMLFVFNAVAQQVVTKQEIARAQDFYWSTLSAEQRSDFLKSHFLAHNEPSVIEMQAVKEWAWSTLGQREEIVTFIGADSVRKDFSGVAPGDIIREYEIDFSGAVCYRDRKVVLRLFNNTLQYDDMAEGYRYGYGKRFVNSAHIKDPGKNYLRKFWEIKPGDLVLLKEGYSVRAGEWPSKGAVDFMPSFKTDQGRLIFIYDIN